MDLLDYIFEPVPDENCLNYLCKILGTITRTKA